MSYCALCKLPHARTLISVYNVCTQTGAEHMHRNNTSATGWTCGNDFHLAIWWTMKKKCATSVAFTSTRPPINSPLSLSIVSQPSHLIRLLSSGNITFPTARWCQHRKFQYGDVEPSLQLVFIPHSHDIKSCAFSAKQLTRLSRLKMNTIFICVIAMNGFAQYLDACNYIRIHIWLFYVCKLAKDKPTIAAAAARSIGDERKR